MGPETGSWYLDLSYDQWVPLPVSVPRPAVRYKHAATVVDEKLYVMGGSRNGRYLSDFQAFDLKNLSWSAIKLKMEANDLDSKDGVPAHVFPATSGHSMIKWGTKLLVVAGLTKNANDKVTVRFIDLELHTCGTIETTGEVPIARSGQTATLFGSKLVMFGGEDWKRSLLNDIHVLDLETMTWKAVETMQKPPTPRYDHTATLHAERYLLIFGGCSHSVFFTDLHLLDLQTMEWSQPQMLGDTVSSRAGHAAVAIEGNCYVVGGGDNKSGALETLLIDMSKLAVSVITTVPKRHALASEGISLSSALLGGENLLVAFGGYNGHYYNEVFVMRLKPRDSTSNPKILESPAAAAAAASVTVAYALAKAEISNLSIKEDLDTKEIPMDASQKDLSAEINAMKEENRALESSIADITAQNSSLKTKLEETNETYAELSKELLSLQGQLVTERSRCAKLEAQIKELRRILESMPSLEQEVQSLRTQKSAFESDSELTSDIPKERSVGIWKWVSG